MVALVGLDPVAFVTLGRVSFVFLVSGSSSAHSAIAYLEGCAPFLLLDALGVGTRDFVRVCFVAAGEGVVVASCSTVILAMSSLRLLPASFVLAALLIASSKAASTSFSSSVSDSSSMKIQFSLAFGGHN